MSALTQHPDFERGRREAAAEIEKNHPPLADVVRRWSAACRFERDNPVLAALLLAQAMAAGRAEAHRSDAEKLALINDALRFVIEAHTGAPFANPLYP